LSANGDEIHKRQTVILRMRQVIASLRTFESHAVTDLIQVYARSHASPSTSAITLLSRSLTYRDSLPKQQPPSSSPRARRSTMCDNGTRDNRRRLPASTSRWQNWTLTCVVVSGLLRVHGGYCSHSCTIETRGVPDSRAGQVVDTSNVDHEGSRGFPRFSAAMCGGTPRSVIKGFAISS
jgi:hypothetical protein